RAHSLRVQLTSGHLGSYTEDQVLNWANGALLGNELLQWTTATQVSAGIYDLTGVLLRGRKGTEWAVGTHQAGERFLVLDPTTIRRVSRDASELNLPRHYRPVTLGGNLSTTPSTAWTNTGVGKKPYSPVWIRGSRDGADSLTLTWIRRTRIDGE